MSTVTVQLFASYAESFGETTIKIAFPAGGTVQELIGRIRALPAAAALPEVPRVAVNRRFAGPEQRLGPDDEIALIPPVAGG